MAATLYKLNINPTDVQKPGSKVEAEVDGLGECKVLVLNVSGTLKAISPKCTHYGAPLKLGVLVQGQARITCPWHGACFNVNSGDIEDAPALDPIHTFPTTEKDGAIYIRGTEEAIKAGRRAPKSARETSSSAPATDEHILIVGGGSGGLGTVEGLREGGFKGKITLLSKEDYAPIDRPKLSKSLLTDLTKLAWRSQDFIQNTLDVDFHPATVVTKIDPSSRTVTTAQGNTFSYTTAVLATGGTPRELPLPGFKSLKNIYVLRGVDHAKLIADATAGNKKSIAVVGSSFIGLEIAALLAKNHEVTVVGMEEAPLERVLGVEVGNKVKALLEKNGVKFKLSASVDSAVPKESEPDAVGGVKLKSGETIPAEVVILGVGVAPETVYLKESGWQLEKDGSVLVDRTFAVKGHEHIFAVGDIARYPYPFIDNTPVRIEHWNVALNSGRAVGRLIAGSGGNNVPVEFIPVFWSAVGQQIRYCGHPAQGFDEVIVRDVGENKFSAYYAKGEQIVAVATMGVDPVMVKSAELLRAYKFPSKSQIKDGVDLLALEI